MHLSGGSGIGSKHLLPSCIANLGLNAGFCGGDFFYKILNILINNARTQNNLKNTF
jgi:hypothetical protein